jgi:hypothetical protein
MVYLVARQTFTDLSKIRVLGPEGEVVTILRNVSNYLPIVTESDARILESAATPL